MSKFMQDNIRNGIFSGVTSFGFNDNSGFYFRIWTDYKILQSNNNYISPVFMLTSINLLLFIFAKNVIAWI